MRQPPRHAGARLAFALAVLAAHLALLLWWLQADRLARREPAVEPRVAVRLVVPRAPVAAPRETAAAPAPAPKRRAPNVPAAAQPAPITAAAISAAPPPSPGASQAHAEAEPQPSLMDSDATRRAIRASARDPGLAAQAGRQGAPVQTPTEKLGEQVQRSAKGDCLKGEYAGGGMGLLSLPFLAAAALNGDCRR